MGRSGESTGERRPASALGRRRTVPSLLLVVALGVLAGCTGQGAPAPSPTLVASDASPTPSGATGTPALEATQPQPPAVPPATAEPQDVVTGLDVPWGLAFLPGGAVLVTQRDAAQVLLVAAGGVTALTGPGADDLVATTTPDGEGGLLGIALPQDTADADGTADASGDGPTDPPQGPAVDLYLYRTTADGNEVVRAPLDPAAATLGPLEPVLTGIPAASNHDGGRIAFGPDGFLYVATGDAGVPGAAQDPGSLAGKILRLTPDGDPAPGNPVDGSPVWSLGHRNVQGLGWTDDGRMVAAEFGQNTFDELNLIEPGANYGWPEVEGTGGDPAFVDPLVTWSTDEASPSGLAVVGDRVHLAALRGERLWSVTLTADGAQEPTSSVDLGRLRHVALGPDGALWVLTGNTDGRGDPRPGDDRLVRLLPP